MSYLVEEELTCSACKMPTKAEVWSVINVRDNPVLKDLLLGGELNLIECSSCKHVFYAEHFLIYHDPRRELMAFVYPLAQKDQRTQWAKKTEEDYKELQRGLTQEDMLKYKPVTLFGLDELVRVVEEDDEESVQTEIASTLSEQHDLPVYKLKLSFARQLNLPAILPYKRDPHLSKTDSITAGLQQLESINDRLFLFHKALETLAANPNLDIPFKDGGS
ncbi:MAG: CpXC domain-containing protein [Elusimicrobia bacterium]|nr:CpXC domain-containing protein [Candidatus Obscuribacterium magneticum]